MARCWHPFRPIWELAGSTKVWSMRLQLASGMSSFKGTLNYSAALTYGAVAGSRRFFQCLPRLKQESCSVRRSAAECGNDGLAGRKADCHTKGSRTRVISRSKSLSVRSPRPNEHFIEMF